MSKVFSSNLPLPLLQGHLPNSRLEELPQEIMLEILDKILAPVVDTSNPFSILENYTFIEPTYATPFSSLLPPNGLDSEETSDLSLAPDSEETSNLPPHSQSLANTNQFDGISLDIDLNPYTKKKKKKKKSGLAPSSSYPSTRSSNGNPPPLNSF